MRVLRIVEVPIAVDASESGAPDFDTTTDEEHDVDEDEGEGEGEVPVILKRKAKIY